MLTGDLWTVNVMLADGAPEPTITGVLDFDRTSWGDPAADWTIRMAQAKPGTEREAFWETYGSVDRSSRAVLRSRIYEARHIGAIRLERHRLGNADGVRETYSDMAAVLADLG
jgi:aminoglycoside phosphotransferase (APT) family kinase protein